MFIEKINMVYPVISQKPDLEDLIFCCGPVSGDRYWFSLALIWPCGSQQQDLDTALRSQQQCQQIQALALCHPSLYSLLLWATVQKQDRYKLRLIDGALLPSPAERLSVVMAEKMQKTSPGPWTRWRVTTFTPPTATSLHVAGWLTWASCTASGGAVIDRTHRKHRYVICCCWLLSWKFTFTIFPGCRPEKQGEHHRSVNVPLSKWHLAAVSSCGLWCEDIKASCLQPNGLHSPQSMHCTYRGKKSHVS